MRKIVRVIITFMLMVLLSLSISACTGGEEHSDSDQAGYEAYLDEQLEEKAEEEEEQFWASIEEEYIPAADASDYVYENEEYKYYGEVKAISDENAYYVDLYAAYPDNSRMTLIIWPEHQSEMQDFIDSVNVGDFVGVKGVTYLYDGVVNLELTEMSQFEFVH